MSHVRRVTPFRNLSASRRCPRSRRRQRYRHGSSPLAKVGGGAIYKVMELLERLEARVAELLALGPPRGGGYVFVPSLRHWRKRPFWRKTASYASGWEENLCASKPLKRIDALLHGVKAPGSVG